MTTVTIGLRPGDTYSGFEDTYLLQSSPTTPQSTSDRFYIAYTGGSAKRGVVKVTGLSNIPSNATVNSASFTFYRLNTQAPANDYEFRQLLANPTISQATWNNRATGTPWQTGGASGALDVDSTVVVTGAIPTGSGSTLTISGAGLTALVQGWVDGSIPNYGGIFQVINEGVDGGDFDIASGERSTTSQRPYMTVDYSIPVTPTASISDVTVNNLSGNAVLTVTLSSDALAGGVAGLINTNDITAIAGVDYTAQVNVAFSIAEGESSGTITIPILP